MDACDAEHLQAATRLLSESIEQLYAVFARYGLPSDVAGCPHCVDDSDHQRIHSKPLRDLSAEDLQRFAFKAMTTWGSSEDFRHMLPRIFELQVTDRAWLDDAEIVFGKLVYGKWRTWPADEQAAVEAFLLAAWDAGLSDYPGTIVQQFDPAVWLEVLLGLGVDTPVIIDRWRANPSQDALMHLTDFLYEKADAVAEGRFWGGWFAIDEDTGRQCAEQLRAWLTEPELIARMEELAAIDTREPFANAAAGGLNSAAVAVYQLEQLRDLAPD